ncbi:unnamed protein product [Caretta caretta]
MNIFSPHPLCHLLGIQCKHAVAQGEESGLQPRLEAPLAERLRAEALDDETFMKPIPSPVDQQQAPCQQHNVVSQAALCEAEVNSGEKDHPGNS